MLNEHDLKVIQAINAENLLRNTLFSLRRDLAAIAKTDRAPEPAKSHLQARIAKTENALAAAVNALNTAEIGKMLSLDIHVVSTSPKRRTMQVVLKDKDHQKSVTRHLKYENGGWHGYSLFRRGIVNFSAAGLLERREQERNAA